MLTRLFTYFSKNGRSSFVGFCSKGAARMVLDTHYDDLMKMWSNPNDPEEISCLNSLWAPFLQPALWRANLLTATASRELLVSGTIRSVSR